MQSDKNQISFRQATMLFLTITSSYGLRIIPLSIAENSKQAGWIAPLVSLFFFIIFLLIMQSFYKKDQKISYYDVLENTTGKYIARFLVIAYIVWLILVLAVYVRGFAERLNSSIYIEDDMSFFIITILILTAWTLRSGITVIARMNEIILPVIIFVFLMLSAFLFPKIDLANLTPISYKDILPVLKGSISILPVYTYFIFIFIFSDIISGKENIKRIGLKAGYLLTFNIILVIICTIGSVGYVLTKDTPVPFLLVIKQISVLGIFDRLDSVLVALWIVGDYILICVFTFAVIHSFKWLFNLSDGKHLISIFLVFMYIMCLYIVNDDFELLKTSTTFGIYANIFLEFIIPIIIFTIAKFRKII